MKISTRLFLILAAGYLIVAGVLVVMINYEMRQQALVEAESKARLILDHNLATHMYFSHQLKPKLFDWTKSFRSSDYFEPTWMSSTYAIREIEKYFQTLSPWKYYYKECAVNARSPENEADPYEQSFLKGLAGNPELEIISAVRELNGKPYFVTLRRGELIEASCLRCHSTPDQAPGDLLKVYGDQRSFHRQAGDVSQAISIRVPLEAAYAEANRFSLRLSGFLLIVLFCLFIFQLHFSRRWVFEPLAAIRAKALQIASSPEYLGETILIPKGKELQEMATAFNTMSINLLQAKEGLELRVQERTRELAATNQNLLVEITTRKRAEEMLLTEQNKIKNILETIPNGVYIVSPNYDIEYVNPVLESEFGPVTGRKCYQYFHDLSEGCPWCKNPEVFAGKSVWWEWKSSTTGKIYDLFDTPLVNADGSISKFEIFYDITARKQAEAEIIRQQEELRGLTARLAEVEELERQELARELHDQVCQNLATINITLETIMIRAHREPLDQVLARLVDVGALAEQTSEITRNIMEDLRPTVLDHYGLMGGLRQLGSQFSKRTGINLEILNEDADTRLAPKMELALFRIAQEALNNVAKHAQASQVVLTAELSQDTVRLVISDNGSGFDQNSVAHPKDGRGWGLMTMSERAMAVGGHCHIESQPGHGTKVVAAVPR